MKITAANADEGQQLPEVSHMRLRSDPGGATKPSTARASGSSVTSHLDRRRYSMHYAISSCPRRRAPTHRQRGRPCAAQRWILAFARMTEVERQWIVDATPARLRGAESVINCSSAHDLCRFQPGSGLLGRFRDEPY
jgi:hypothetical protein